MKTKKKAIWLYPSPARLPLEKLQGILDCFLYLNHSIVSCDGQCNSFDSVLSRCLCGAHADKQQP